MCVCMHARVRECIPVCVHVCACVGSSSPEIASNTLKCGKRKNINVKAEAKSEHQTQGFPIVVQQIHVRLCVCDSVPAIFGVGTHLDLDHDVGVIVRVYK